MRVYKITNKNTNKVYVGKTKGTIDNRFKKHKRNAKDKINRYLYDSMNHHGFDAFSIEEIEECDNEDILNEREKFWIKEFDCFYPNGYNMTRGGDGGNTLRHWPEEKRKAFYKAQGEKRRGKRSDEFRKTMSIASKKREANKTEEERNISSKKISETLKRKYSEGMKAVTPDLSGQDHPGYIHVDINIVLEMIRKGNTLKIISQTLNVSPHGIRSRLVENTGKNYKEWVSEYGIRRKINVG